MFNIDIPYKSDSFFAFLKSKKGIKSYLPMKLMVAQKPGSKKLFYYMHFSTSLEMPNKPLRHFDFAQCRLPGRKNYCILRPVLWMQ